MATRTSNGTGGGLWSATGTWAGGVVPVDGDAVVIAAGDTVTFDVDHSAWTTGLTSLTITSSSGTPGKLKASETTGDYVLMMGANATIIGTSATNLGILQAGTSKAVPYPSDCTFTIILGTTAANSMAQIVGQYLNLQLFCGLPTIRYVQCNGAFTTADDTVTVDQDVTSDLWNVGDFAVAINAVTTGTRTSEVLEIAAITATTIQFTSTLTYNLPDESFIVLRTRNVRMFCQSVLSTNKDMVNCSSSSASTAHRMYAELTNLTFTNKTGTGSPSAVSGTEGKADGVRRRGTTAGTDLGIFGGVVCGFGSKGYWSGGGKLMTAEMDCVAICCDIAFDYAHSFGANLLIAGCNYGGSSNVYGTLVGVGSARSIGSRMGGSWDSNSLAEYCGSGIGSFETTYPIFFDGTCRNCGIIGGGIADLTLGQNARVGSGCTTGFAMYTGKVRLFGARFNHATPVTTYSGIQDPFSSILGYDYADSSDIPQYGQLRCWMGAGTIASETPPGTPPVTLNYAHKMSHENADLDLKIDIPLVVEAGTPVEITCYLNINSGAYSWNTAPDFQLFDPSINPLDSSGILAQGVDVNGDPPDATATGWQTLYILYLPAVASNFPLGAKRNLVLRVTGNVSDATGTPYWHWNYTQGEVVNANVQYVSGADEMITQMAKDVGDNQALIIAGL